MNYEPAEETKVPLNMRVPKSLKASLEDAVKLWKLQAVARGDDPTNIDVTHVTTKLLKIAVAGEFHTYGGRPTDPEGWKTIEAAINEGVAKVRQLRQPKK